MAFDLELSRVGKVFPNGTADRVDLRPLHVGLAIQDAAVVIRLHVISGRHLCEL